MPIFQLNEQPVFPPTHLAEPSGLLAIGGDLAPQRLVQAYAQGIFPWFNEGDPILWHAPPERMVLQPADLRINRSTRKALKSGVFAVSMDSAFGAVIEACAAIPRPGQHGTWITDDMADAYERLHRMGLAHSVETWRDGELVGGLYGVSLGAAFFGESMFSLAPNASKVAFVTLVQQLQRWEFTLIDCQVHTPLLESFGALEVPRLAFEELLYEALDRPTRAGSWGSQKENSALDGEREP